MFCDDRVKSLYDLLDAEVANLYFIDNCELGMNFSGSANSLRIDSILASTNNLPIKKVREARNNARQSVELLKKYTQIKVTPEIFQEYEWAIKKVKRSYNTFGNYRHHRRYHNRGMNTGTHQVRKEKGMLDEILVAEQEAMDVLRGRLPCMEDRKIRAYKDLVISAWSEYGGRNDKNNNDEKMVAAALCHAVSQQKYVAIITRDSRIVPILIRVQQAVESSNKCQIGDNMRKTLKDGKVMVVTRWDSENRDRYDIAYCSQDFDTSKGRKKVSDNVISKIELCYV